MAGGGWGGGGSDPGKISLKGLCGPVHRRSSEWAQGEGSKNSPILFSVRTDTVSRSRSEQSLGGDSSLFFSFSDSPRRGGEERGPCVHQVEKPHRPVHHPTGSKPSPDPQHPRQGRPPTLRKKTATTANTPWQPLALNDDQLEDLGETMAKAEEPQGLRWLDKTKREKSWCRPQDKAHPEQG